jgi:hypothetical protein
LSCPLGPPPLYSFLPSPFPSLPPPAQALTEPLLSLTNGIFSPIQVEVRDQWRVSRPNGEDVLLRSAAFSVMHGQGQRAGIEMGKTSEPVTVLMPSTPAGQAALIKGETATHFRLSIERMRVHMGKKMAVVCEVRPPFGIRVHFASVFVVGPLRYFTCVLRVSRPVVCLFVCLFVCLCGFLVVGRLVSSHFVWSARWESPLTCYVVLRFGDGCGLRPPTFPSLHS